MAEGIEDRAGLVGASAFQNQWVGDASVGANHEAHSETQVFVRVQQGIWGCDGLGRSLRYAALGRAAPQHFAITGVADDHLPPMLLANAEAGTVRGGIRRFGAHGGNCQGKGNGGQHDNFSDSQHRGVDANTRTQAN